MPPVLNGAVGMPTGISGVSEDLSGFDEDMMQGV